MKNEHPNPKTTEAAIALTAELLDRLALDHEGRPFDDNEPATWAEADDAEPEIVLRGQARFKIVDADARALALAAGAVEDGAPPSLYMRVEFDPGADQPLPRMGSYVVVPTDEPDVSLTFVCWLTHEDLHDPAAPDLGGGKQRDLALDALRPGQALLVQVLPEVESEGDR